MQACALDTGSGYKQAPWIQAGASDIEGCPETGRGPTQRHNLEAESLSFLEKTRIFGKSLYRDNKYVGFFLPSRLNNPDEKYCLPLEYLFSKLYSK